MQAIECKHTKIQELAIYQKGQQHMVAPNSAPCCNLVRATRRARLCEGYAVDRVYSGDGLARNQTSEDAEDGTEHLPLHL
jgi:hypothetical protein